MSGEIVAMSRAEYATLARCNWSALRYMRQSPLHYRHALLAKQVDTDAMKLGRITHLAVLEPERYRTEVAVYEDRRAGKEWKKFQADHAGMEIVKPAQDELARAVATAARADKVAAEYLAKGRSEVTLLWEAANGVACKGRADFLTETALVDLKTCRNASEEAFPRQVANLGSHAQLAFYHDGIRAITGKSIEVFVVAVETAPPFAVTVFEVNEDMLEAGRMIYEPLLERLKQCQAENHWPSYSETVVQLHLPTWALPSESDYDGLGLNFPTTEAADATGL